MRMMGMALLLALCLASQLYAVSAVIGVDVSQPTSSSAFSCLRNAGYDFAIVRGYQSNGAPDQNCPATVAAAWAGGMAHVDVYMFPCSSCGNPAGQMQQFVQFLDAHGVKYGQMWLDIEGPGTYWGSNQGANQAFFSGLVSQAHAMGVNLGVYTSAYQWGSIFGNWGGGASLPLWYAHWDGGQNFNDWAGFGGWGHPNMKQFNDNGSGCGASYDYNWYPDGFKLPTQLVTASTAFASVQVTEASEENDALAVALPSN